MKNNVSKITLGIFLFGLGLMWLGTNLGLIDGDAFSGILFSFILILVGVRIIFRGNHEEREDRHRVKNAEQATGKQAHSAQNQNINRASSEDRDYNSNDTMYKSSEKRSAGKEHYTAILSSQNIRYTEEFTGAEIIALAGGVELDLRNAEIPRDIVIDVNCFMGGITIFLPSGVKVSVSCTPIMGGVESRIDGTFSKREQNVTVYIRGTCFMGGIEIK